ncbi:MAG: PAS domain S-box protein [Candidatus Electrothrix sp. AR4]|nr:PAS domain S-box protein [Candidatus Electrothrix sp. AR4]
MTAIAQGIRRVLVIDDNQEIHNDIKAILNPTPGSDELDGLLADITGKAVPQHNNPVFQIESAFQGDEGIRMVRQARLEERPYALAYVDMRIPPGLDGLETIKKLQKEDDRLQYVIITAYSDYSWQDISESLVSRDNLLILKKPFESIEIRQTASALIEKWHIAMEREQVLAALAMQRDLLEEQVRERTAELDKKNALLRREIEERKKAEEHIRRHRDMLEEEVTQRSIQIIEQNKFLNTVINSLPHPLTVVDIESYNIVTANKAANKAAGVTENDTGKNKKCYQYAHGLNKPCHEQGVPCPLRGIRRNGQPIVVEHTLPDKEGNERTVEIHTYPVTETHGKTNRVIEYIIDITQRKKEKEELLKNQKMEMIATLAGGIAHDFNNLLMAILGNIELAVINLPEKHSSFDFLQNATVASMQAKELTNKFLLFSNFEPPIRQAVSLADLITASCKAFLANSNVIPEFHFPPDLWMGYIDPDQIDHALCELLSNAQEAMNHGGKIVISAKNIPDATLDHIACTDGGYIRITLKDEGCGILRENLPNIFDPYFSGKIRAEGKGMGLGLTIVASIISQHQGYIDVDSTPGKSTTIYIDLPAVSDQE